MIFLFLLTFYITINEIDMIKTIFKHTGKDYFSHQKLQLAVKK